jgi:hypothetical protein
MAGTTDGIAAITSVTFRYGGRNLLVKIDLEIQPGETKRFLQKRPPESGQTNP